MMGSRVVLLLDHLLPHFSLPAATPEKVWYCEKKGYKPWFNPKEADVRTNEEGGHTRWQNEMELLEACEKRVGKAIDRLETDLSLPEHIRQRLAARGGEYGEVRRPGRGG